MRNDVQIVDWGKMRNEMFDQNLKSLVSNRVLDIPERGARPDAKADIAERECETNNFQTHLSFSTISFLLL